MKVSNTTNYNSGGYNSVKPKFKPRLFPIILISVLFLVFIISIIFYFKLKHTKETNSDIDYQTTITNEDSQQNDNFSGVFNYNIKNMYGLDFSLTLSGAKSEYTLLGKTLSDIYKGKDLYIEGSIYETGADFTIYTGIDNTNTLYSTAILINNDGVFASIKSWGFSIYSEENQIENALGWESEYSQTYVKLADGLTGKTIKETIANYIYISASNKNVEIGDITEDLSIKYPSNTLSSVDINSFANLLNEYNGKLEMDLLFSNTAPNREFNIKGSGSDFTFNLNIKENPKTVGSKILDNRYKEISLEEYEKLISLDGQS